MTLNEELLKASEDGRTSDVIALLDRGAEIEAKDPYGKRALHRAAGRGCTETCLILLNAGANIEAKDESGCTALHAAAREGHHSTCLALLDSGANIEVKDDREWTPLHWSARFGQIDACLVLIDRGVELEAKNKENLTAMNMAGFSKSIETCLALIASGAETNGVKCGQKVLSKYTRLQAAAQIGDPGILLREMERIKDDPAMDNLILGATRITKKAKNPVAETLIRSWLAQRAANQAITDIASELGVKP